VDPSNTQDESAEQAVSVPTPEDVDNLAACKKLVEQEPDNPEALLSYGQALVSHNELDLALKQLSKAADILTSTDQLEKAIQTRENLAMIQPGDVANLFDLADIYERTDRRDDAITTLKKCAVTAREKDDWDTRYKSIRQILAMDRSNVRAQLQLIEECAKNEKVELAAEHLAELSIQLEQQERWDTFIPVMQRLLHFVPEQVDGLEKLARAHLHKGEPELALPRLRTCYSMDPESPTVLGLLADAFNQLGQPSKATATLKKKAAVYEKNGMDAEYREVLRQLLATDPATSGIKKILKGSEADANESEDTLGELEISEVSDEEIDALIEEIQSIEDDGELSVGSLLSDDDVMAEAPPQMSPLLIEDNLEDSTAAPTRAPFPTVTEDSVITSITGDDLQAIGIGNTASRATKDEIESLVAMFEKELADEDTESGIGLDTDELEALNLEADFETYPSEIPPMAVPDNDNTETSQRLPDAIEEETSDEPDANMSAELEELDFYIENGLIDEASDLLTELEKQFPDAEELAERRKLLS
tara:strand:+ start:997 stop:2598 length:1602 start_codon:yes stop_codon:yes gene_type:complete